MAESSGNTGIRVSGLTAPRPEVLASITDQHVLAVIEAAEAPLSRAEIAETTGLSKPAVSAAAARLSERGVIHDVGVREGRRGGVATLYALNEDYGRSLAVVIGNESIAVQARDLSGAVRVALESRLTQEHPPQHIVAETNRLIAEAAAAFPAPLLAVAVSIADPVDAHSGTPLVLPKSVFPAADIHPTTEFDLSDAARVVVDNDVNWATIGEYHEGELRGSDDFAYVYFGQGIGAGLLLNGRLFHGHRGLSGEIGYVWEGADGRLDVTERLALLGLGSPGVYGLDLAKADAILAPDPLGDAAVAASEVLAFAVANLTMVINPSAIAFGGPLSVYPAFAEALGQRIAALSIDPPRFVVSTSTPLLGASIEAHRLALEEAGIPDVAARSSR
ncbi:MAG: ROK family transcriptional regulator [Microbacterium sp.]